MSHPRGRHRKTGKAAKAARIAVPGVAAGAITLLAAPGAHAQEAVVPVSPGAAQIFSMVKEKPVTPQAVTVRHGDSLSALAQRWCGTSRDWTGWWNYNHHRLKLSSPDVIYPGQRLVPDCRSERVWLPHPAVAVTTTTAEVSSARRVSYSAPRVSTSGMGGFQACVIRAESGGNPGIWNASGHWGLYQFSSSTWAAHGGDPALFGHAGPAYQTRIFWNTVHADGTSDWAPYDGC